MLFPQLVQTVSIQKSHTGSAQIHSFICTVQICKFGTTEEMNYVQLDTSDVLEFLNLHSGWHPGEWVVLTHLIASHFDAQLIVRAFIKHTCQTFSASSFSNVRIWCFSQFFIIHCELNIWVWTVGGTKVARCHLILRQTVMAIFQHLYNSRMGSGTPKGSPNKYEVSQDD